MNEEEGIYLKTCPTSGFQVVDHIDGYKCLLDTTTFEYYRLPDIKGKVLIDKKLFYFFDTINEYLKSDVKKSLIPVFCNSVKKHKKRWKTIILSDNDTFDFYNTEMINNTWTHNETDSMQPMAAYFVFCEKHNDADNGFLIRKSKLIVRRG